MPTRPRYTSESQNLPRRVRKELVTADQKTQPTTVEWNSDIVFEVGAHCCLVQRDGRVIVFMCREEHTSDYSNHPIRGHIRNYFWTQISPSRSSSDSSSLSSSPDGHTFPTSPPSHHPYFQQSRYASDASTRHAQSSSRPTSHHRAHSFAVAHAPNGHATYDRRDGYPEPTYPFPSAHGYTGPPGQDQKSTYTTYANPTQQGFPTEQDYAYSGTQASVSSHGRRHTSMLSDSRAGHDPRVEALHQTQREYAVAPVPGRYQTHLDAPIQQYDNNSSRKRSRERYV